MRKFWKFLRIGFLCGWRLLFEYFVWILRYSSHPEKYPIETRYFKARRLIVFVLSHMGFDLRVSGEIPFVQKEPALFVANHTSALDPLMLVALSPKPLSFVAKAQTRKYPFAGRLIRSIEGVFLDRDDPFQAVRAFKTVAKNMKTYGLSYCIFPEGTRNRTPLNGVTGEFHPGSFKILQMASCGLVVYVSFGAYHCFANDRVKGHVVAMKTLSYTPFEALKGRKTVELSDEAKALIDAELPALVAFDKEVEAKKNKDKSVKWWKNLPKE